ncbi:MAG: hypothetical protein EP334_07560 [Gammaproteobacteria bacterium]|nr:MAG: hypothetical protein EP334_07560 [Gammaproteobacteria bacterium]
MSSTSTPLTQSLRGNARQFYVRGIKALKPNHPDVIRLRGDGHCPSEFGSRIWRATYLLIDYLSSLSLADTRQVIELGCGWGLAGTYLQKWFDVEVMATDIDANVFPYQQLLCQHNDIEMQTRHCSLSQLCEYNLHDIDLMIGADICYSDENAQDIEKLCHHLADQGGGELILADSGREPFEKLIPQLQSRYQVDVTATTLELPAIASGQILHVVAA